MTSRTFPLLRLTDSARDNVLRNFGFCELIDISLISKRMIPIVKSLNLQIQSFTLTLDQKPLLFLKAPSYIVFWTFEKNGENLFESTFRYGYNKQCSKKDYLLKDYIVHFLDVLNKNRLDSVAFQQEENKLDLDVLRSGLPKTARITIWKNYSVAHLNCFVTNFPEAGKFVFRELEKKMPNIFIQNFDLLSSGYPVRTWNLSLDEILEMNSAQIKIAVAGISEKVLNRFLKMWVKGASPRLKFLELQFLGRPRRQDILNGIKHRVVEQVRQFEVLHEERDTVKRITVAGGVDVRRKNGVVGTIVYENRKKKAIRLHVWH